MKGDQFSIADKVRQVLDKAKMMERELEQLKGQAGGAGG